MLDGAGVSGGGREVDRAGEVFEQKGLKAEADRIQGRVADTEVEGQDAEEEPGKAAFAQKAGQTGARGLVVLNKGGVAVDVLTKAFAQDEFGVRDLQRGRDLGARRALESVVRPEALGAVGGLGGVNEGPLAGVA